jgi:hypothetical protein
MDTPFTDDIDTVVTDVVAMLRPAVSRDWQVPAGTLEWTCWETLEHMSDDLFAYATQLAPRQPLLDKETPFACRHERDGGPAGTIFASPAAGNAGLLQVLEACATMLIAVVRITPERVRAYHVYGISDPDGFAAMGVAEVLLHADDVAAGLGLPWAPPAGMCDRVLRRLFPDAPAQTDRWATLLWATGRGELPGRPAVQSWRWDGTPR